MFSNVWSENTALFERLMEIHSNSPKLYYGFKFRFWITIFVHSEPELLLICSKSIKDKISMITVEPRYNEVLGTMKITLLYQVSHFIRVQTQRNIESWDQQNYLVLRGFCYIRPLYNEVPLYL